MKIIHKYDKYDIKKIILQCIVVMIILISGLVVLDWTKGQTDLSGHKTVICIPVYGQSYALGEEAIRITDFDSLRIQYNGRIVNEKMDYVFGYYDHSSRFKQYIKRLLHYDRKAFELAIYGMAEALTPQLGEDTILCIFPGGLGQRDIARLSKSSQPYIKFMEEIEFAYKTAKEKGWDFTIPAICWMQGESDIANYPETDYKSLFYKIHKDFNRDIKQITHQKNDIRIICYQSSALTKGDRFEHNNYEGSEGITPHIQMEIIRDDSLVWAMGPTYPYDFVREALHIDAIGQKRIGNLAAKSALGILRNANRFKGVVPIETIVKDKKIAIIFNVPTPPLCFDTIQVNKVNNYGFNVVDKKNIDIISDVTLHDDTILITCQESPIGCKIRYGVNGDYTKGGRLHGPRGNLRDSQGNEHQITIKGNTYRQDNWCLIFDYLCKDSVS